MLNSASNWIPFTQSSYYSQYGIMNSNLLVLEKLFKDYPQQVKWKIELATTVIKNANQTLTGFTSIIFYVNFSPRNGTCDITPKMGSTSNLFTIYCHDWIDTNGNIHSYAYYGYF